MARLNIIVTDEQKAAIEDITSNQCKFVREALRREFERRGKHWPEAVIRWGDWSRTIQESKRREGLEAEQ